MEAKLDHQPTERYRSIYSVPKMDCPSEENLIRMALASLPIKNFSFDLQNRRVTIEHAGLADEVSKRLDPLKLGATLLSSERLSDAESKAVMLQETTFSIPKMDCPSEENLIRMALSSEPVQSLRFDLPNRTLYVLHSSNPATLLGRLSPLNLGAFLKETRVSSTPANNYHQTVFAIPKMDCPSEENLIRMALQEFGDDVRLTFDLKSRQLRAVHQIAASAILAKLVPLNLGASIVETARTDVQHASSTAGPDDAGEARTLRLLLAINGIMFVIEMVLGLMAQSAGLVADSLDMFADAAVYGLSLYAVGRAVHMKVRAAHIAGWLQMVLALGALVEVIRRFVFGSEPASDLMMGIGLLALIANVTCLVLISRKRDHGVHMKASYIFSANDVLANIGVIVAGVLVHWKNSSYPDLVIGTVIALIVMRGAQRILKLS